MPRKRKWVARQAAGVAASRTRRDWSSISARPIGAPFSWIMEMIPPMKRIGMKTATSETLIETTVKATSFAPLSAAS